MASFDQMDSAADKRTVGRKPPRYGNGPTPTNPYDDINYIMSQFPGMASPGTFDENQLRSRAGNVQYDPSGVNALRDYATAAPGTSPWERMQLERQQMGQSQQLGAAGTAANAATQNAYSQVAQRGGLGAGARERIAMQSSRDLNARRQAIYGQGAQDRLGIGIQGEQNRLQALGQLPGAQAQAVSAQIGALSPWQQLIQNSQEQAAEQNKYNLGRFDIWSKLYGANKSADATIAAHK